MRAEIIETKVLYENEHSAHNYVGWPTVARLRDGKLMMVASGFRVRHVCPFGKAIACLSYNDGETWTPPMVIIDTKIDDRDCGVLPFGESSVMVMSFGESLEYTKEFYGALDENHPRTPRFGRHKEYSLAYYNLMKDEENLDEFIGSHFRVSHDNGLTYGPIVKCKPQIPHGPCLLPDGRIFGIGNIMGDGMHYDREMTAYIIDPETGDCEFVSRISTDDFFEEHVIACEPYAIVTKSGKLICQFRLENESMTIKTTYQCESYDEGKTWTKPRRIFPDDSGCAPTHIMQNCFNNSGERCKN